MRRLGAIPFGREVLWLMSAGKKGDYFADRIRAELAFARSRGARDPAALAEHLNARGFLTRDGRRWTAEDVEAATRRPPRQKPGD